MCKVTHREQDKMRYTMKTNARRALKTHYGQAARDLADHLIHQDDIGFYIVEREVLQAVKAARKSQDNAPAPTAAPSTSNVLRTAANPVVVKSCLEALKAEEAKDLKDPKAAPTKAIEPKVVKATKDKKSDRCNFKNGARKPLKGKTAEVWAMGDKLLAELGRTPELKEMKDAMPSYNGTTVAIQFYAWRKYNGLQA